MGSCLCEGIGRGGPICRSKVIGNRSFAIAGLLFFCIVQYWEARSISMNGYVSTTPTIPMTTAQRKNASMPCSCHRRIPAWRLQTRQKRLGPSDIKRHERLIDDGWLGGTNRFRLIPDPWRVDKGIAIVRGRVHGPRKTESQH
jgi:hypothetical protein